MENFISQNIIEYYDRGFFFITTLLHLRSQITIVAHFMQNVLMDRAKHSFLLCLILLSCLVMNKTCLNQNVLRFH